LVIFSLALSSAVTTLHASAGGMVRARLSVDASFEASLVASEGVTDGDDDGVSTEEDGEADDGGADRPGETLGNSPQPAATSDASIVAVRADAALIATRSGRSIPPPPS
jgi:hypothetical protein